MFTPGVWFLAGFAVAIFLATEVKGAWGLVTFVCGLIARYVFMELVIKRAFREMSSPVALRFWSHAKAYGQGAHTVKDPRDCQACQL